MRTLALFLLAALAIAQAPSSFRSVGTVSQLMIDIIYPASDAIFYVERAAPQNDKEWNSLRGTALVLAESGNLLMMSDRARDQGDWMKDAKMLVDVGTLAYRAAQAKDLAGILALNDQLNAACVVCHQQYRPGYRRRQ